MKNRIGETNTNRFGRMMEIIKYNKSSDILIRFDNGIYVHTNYQSFLKGEIKNVYDRTVGGVGFIGEGEYRVNENGKHTRRYKTWYSMLMRCYDEKHQERQPTYKGCSVADEWHNFQNFAKWYDENYYEIEGERMQLDKDIFIKGNKVYSPETCIFVPYKINMLFVKSNATRGELPIGVHLDKNRKEYRVSRCYGGATCGSRFDTPEKAFNAYKTYKERHIKTVAEEHKDKIPSKLFERMINYTVEITD